MFLFFSWYVYLVRFKGGDNLIYLMRHGQDDEVYVGGWSKVSLIPEGIEEVKESGIWIRDNLHIEEIICSDVLRAQESAQIVGDRKSVV